MSNSHYKFVTSDFKIFQSMIMGAIESGLCFDSWADNGQFFISYTGGF